MTRLKRALEAIVLVGAGYASLATSSAGPERVDEHWVLTNVFDERTAVPLDFELELRIGVQDFEGEGSVSKARSKAQSALRTLSLRDLTSKEPIELEFELGQVTTRARPVAPLRENTRYELDAVTLVGSATAERPIPEVIQFTTQPGPRVTGLWRVDDTLMIAFSEPIAPGVLELAPDSVDLLWRSAHRLYAVSADRNLADFAWDDDGLLFRVGPIPEVDELWVKVSGNVRGVSGAPLDGDADGKPGEANDDFLELVAVSSLPTCFSASDRPEPCVP